MCFLSTFELTQLVPLYYKFFNMGSSSSSSSKEIENHPYYWKNAADSSTFGWVTICED